MTPQPMIAVADVKASSAWYQRTLGLTSGHGGGEYEMLMAGERMVLQLHALDAHEHTHLGDPSKRPYGNGTVLWFRCDDVAAAYRCARDAGASVLEPLGVNPNANHREFWLQDPDGYVVVVAGRYGDVG